MFYAIISIIGFLAVTTVMYAPVVRGKVVGEVTPADLIDSSRSPVDQTALDGSSVE